MTTVKHHIPETVLASYAAGTLGEAFSLVVATHVSMCDACRAALAGYETVGGAVLEGVDSVALDDDALKTVMALIAEAPADTPPAPRAHSIFPAPLAGYVGGGPDAVKWRRVGGGVKQAVLADGEDGSVRLLYIPAGTSVPDHTHKGLELTLVLQGAFSDEVDRFARGDVEVGDDDLEHTPIAEAGADCICLAATDAPLVFKSFLPRLVQPFIGI